MRVGVRVGVRVEDAPVAELLEAGQPVGLLVRPCHRHLLAPPVKLEPAQHLVGVRVRVRVRAKVHVQVGLGLGLGFRVQGSGSG